MGEQIVLQAKGVYKGNLARGVQFFDVVGEDQSGNTYLLHFMCKDHYTDTIINAFRRLHPVPMQKLIEPADAPTTEGENTNG
jgi:hypothetical protein